MFVKLKRTFHKIIDVAIDNDNNYKTACGKTVRALPEEKFLFVPDGGKLCKRCDKEE
jgi:hypothetical protein